MAQLVAGQGFALDPDEARLANGVVGDAVTTAPDASAITAGSLTGVTGSVAATSGNDCLVGEKGSDWLGGNVKSDRSHETVNASDTTTVYEDVALGGGGSDTLVGGHGADLVDGGRGRMSSLPASGT